MVPGEIAVIDHRDLDAVAAESLIAAKVAAVLNAAPATSGRYPNLGPKILTEHGVVLIDRLGSGIMKLSEGQLVSLDRDEVWSGGTLVGRGRLFTKDVAWRLNGQAEAALPKRLGSFLDNTLHYAGRESGLFFKKPRLPDINVFQLGRPAVVVVRGSRHREDLRRLSKFILVSRPTLVGVDGGADALREMGWNPDLIIGDMDSVSDQSLRTARERLVHAYRDGRAPGLIRLKRLGLNGKVWAFPGTSEDIALLLAYEFGARPIVAVGSHSSPIDFLEKGRPGMGSTLLVRMKLGTALIDARGLSDLLPAPVLGLGSVSLMALAPAAAALIVSPGFRLLKKILWLKVRLAFGI